MTTLTSWILVLFSDQFRKSIAFDSCTKIFCSSHFKEVLVLGVPSILMVILNYFSWQKTQLIIQFVGNDMAMTNAHLILLNIASTFQNIGIGL